MIYVLAYPNFNEQVTCRLDDFRCIHEPERAKLVAPHVTLVFGVPQKLAEDVVHISRQVANITSPFSLEFLNHEISYDSFEEVHKISLGCSKGANFLISMHEKFYQGPLQDELHVDIPYRPHMTIGANANISKLENVDISTIGSFPIKAEIKSLNVVELSGNKLHTINSIKLI